MVGVLNNGENPNPQQNLGNINGIGEVQSNQGIESLDTEVNNNSMPDISNIEPKFSEPLPDDKIIPVKKKKGKKIIIILVVLLVLLCGGYYYYDNYIVTPKKVFEKGIDNLNASLVKNSASADTYTGYVKANIKNDDINVGGTINYAIDYSGQKILLDYDTKYKDQALLSGKAFLTSDKLYLYLNNIYDKYIYLDNSESEFKDLFKKVDSTDVINIENSLSKALKSSLTDEYYSKEREGTQNIFIITLNANNSDNLIKNIYTNLKSDDTFIKSFANISNKSESDVKDMLNDEINQFSSTATNTDKGTATIKIYATMLTNKINKIEMNLDDTDEKDNLVLNIVNKNTTNYTLETNHQSALDKIQNKETTTTTYSGTITTSLNGNTTIVKITVKDSQNSNASYDLEYSQTINGTVSLPDVSNAINYDELSFDTDIENIYTNLMNNAGFKALYDEYVNRAMNAASEDSYNSSSIFDDSSYSSDNIFDDSTSSSSDIFNY
jgi:hypothetical protein